jgi:hypothetical protein
MTPTGAEPHWHNGNPHCASSCPSRDGAACALTTFRVEVHCEPTIAEMAARIKSEPARLAAAVRDEREACAALCEQVARYVVAEQTGALTNIAAVIRARGAK